MAPEVLVFDLGGVLFDWDPRYLYRDLLPDESAVEEFLARIEFDAWNSGFDAGVPLAEGAAALKARQPAVLHGLIDAYCAHWPRTLKGSMPDTVAVLEDLARGTAPLYALTNWSAETFHHARRHPFMRHFEDIVVSGEERLAKPDPRIYAVLLRRTGLPAAAHLFIDDKAENVVAARTAGLAAVQFTTAEQLRQDLRAYDFL